MRFLVLLSFLFVLAGCDVSNGVHRSYIISQSEELPDPDLKDSMNENSQ